MTETRLQIRARRVPWPVRVLLLPLVACLAFWLIEMGDADYLFLGWGLALGVGYASLRYILRAIFPPHLLLTAEGFRVQGLGNRSLVRWSEVDRFWQLIAPTKKPVILYGGRGPLRTMPGLWMFRGLPSEADGYIPDGMALDTPALLNLLNEWKARYGG